MYLRTMYLSTVGLGSGARTNGRRKTCGAMSRIDGDTTKKVTWLHVPHIRTHTRMPACMVRFRVGTGPGVWSQRCESAASFNSCVLRRVLHQDFLCWTRIMRLPWLWADWAVDCAGLGWIRDFGLRAKCMRVEGVVRVSR
jgi:hypothetical protein